MLTRCFTLSSVSLMFDPDDYDLRWPPELFVDEANRLLGRRSSPDAPLVQVSPTPSASCSVRIPLDWILSGY
jgi:hypothetical protein